MTEARGQRRFGWLLCLVGLGAWGAAVAQGSLQAVPALQARVTDLARVLSSAEQSALETTLKNFETETDAQIAVLIVPSTQPEAIEQYGIRVVDAWQLGRAGVDDGALLLVAVEDRGVRIEVGRGLEGALTDLTSRRIIDESIIPLFRTGDYATGITLGVERMMTVVRGEPLPAPKENWRAGDEQGGEGAPLWGELFGLTLFALFAGSAFLRAVLGRFPGSLATGAVTGGLGLLGGAAWPWAIGLGLGGFLLALLFSTLPSGRSALGRHRDPFGGLGHHRGGFGGGFGGGGFGGGFGGGGGGFGGGGASGRW